MGGLGLLSGCLRKLGLSEITGRTQADARVINRLLFQDLGVSWQQCGPLPRDWLSGAAAKTAKARLGELLTDARAAAQGNTRLFVCDPLFSRVLPLWLDVLDTLELQPVLLQLVRHPHEVALGLRAAQGGDLLDGHLLWLTYLWESLNGLAGRPVWRLTFDQLLADPLTALSRLITSGQDGQSLLDFVDPAQQHHYASRMTEADRERFAPQLMLYNALRNKYSQTDIPTLEAALVAHGVMGQLLSALDRKPPAAAPVAGKTRTESPLTCSVSFPRSGQEAMETFTLELPEGQWHHATLSVSDPRALRERPLVVQPHFCSGVLRLAGLRIVHLARQEVLWEITDFNACTGLAVAGRALRLPDINQLVVAPAADGVRVTVRPACAVPDGPIGLELWIKAARDDAVLDREIPAVPREPAPAGAAVKAHFARKMRQSSLMRDLQQANRGRFEAFRELSGPAVKTETFWGNAMTLLEKEVVSRNIYATGCFEPELCSFFIDFLFAGATFLDVGAHIGFFSMLGAELVGREGRVFSFEPTPATREVLRENVSRYPQVEIVPMMAWNKKDIHEFFSFNKEYSAYNTAIADRLSPQQKIDAQCTPIRVESTTLDDFCSERTITPDFIKIDVESAEMQVLQGMVGVLKNIRPVLTLEVGDMAEKLEKNVPPSQVFLKYATGFGYIPIEFSGRRYQWHTVRDTYTYENIILVPVEKLPTRRPLDSVTVQSGRFF